MSGPLSLVGTTPGKPGSDGAGGTIAAPGRRRRVPSWARPDPMAELAERLGESCASAVHPDEVAALLESEGLTDEQITGEYRHRDLFSLAAELFAYVPRAFPEPDPVPDPWAADVWRCVLRGLTFALPGVAYLLGGRWAAGPDGPFGVSRAVAAWGAAALCGWGWNQALAHRAHLLLLVGRPRAAARFLLAGAVSGALLSTAAAACVLGATRPAALAFAAGQSLYIAAATALLVLGRERALLHVLVPLTVAACCGATKLPSAVVAAVLAATVLATAGTALSALLAAGSTHAADKDKDEAANRLAARARSARAGLRELCRPEEEAAAGAVVPAHVSLPHGLAGLAGGALVIAAALSGEFVAALTVSMGIAEWLLFRIRSRCLVALRATGVGERLVVRSWRVLAGCLGWYAATLIALAAVEAVALPGAARWSAGHVAVLLALGGTLWLQLLLQSCGRPWTGAGVLGAAAATAVVLLAVHAAAPGRVLGLVCAGACVLLLAAARAITGRVTTHR